MNAQNQAVNDLQSPPQTGYGFFCRVTDRQHFARIQKRNEEKGYFTDRVLFDRVAVRLSDLALIVSPEGLLVYAAHIRPTRTGTTGTRGFRGDHLVELNVTAPELQAKVDAKIWADASRGFTEPAFRPLANIWNALWAALKQLRPQKMADLRRLEQLRFDDVFEFDGSGFGEQRYYEKDAVAVALQVAGISYQGVFAELAEGFSARKPLLQALCGNTTEDVHIDHDVRNFPGFLRTTDILHSCEFTQHGRTLTIYNVNRRRAEAALGVDMIYRNATFGSYTFVQYKMLNQEGSAISPKWVYRPDGQFSEEFDRMCKAHDVFSAERPGPDPNTYRIGGDAFYFKFCRRQHLRVNAGMLVHGHYLTLSHLKLLLGSSASDGARGGQALGPHNMGRWLSRTQFAPLIACGWIGTTALTDEALSKYIDDTLARGKSIVVASGRGGASSPDHDERDDEYD